MKNKLKQRKISQDKISSPKKMMLVYNTFSSEELSLKSLMFHQIGSLPPIGNVSAGRHGRIYLPGLLQEMDNDLEKSENQIWVGWFLKSDLKYQWINNPEIIDIFDVLKDYSLDEIQNGFHLARLCRKKDERVCMKYNDEHTLSVYF